MKGFTDEPNYTIELLAGGTTLEDVLENHIYEQALVSECHMLRGTRVQVFARTNPTSPLQPAVVHVVYHAALLGTSYIPLNSGIPLAQTWQNTQCLANVQCSVLYIQCIGANRLSEDQKPD